jgi:hypothetical protein
VLDLPDAPLPSGDAPAPPRFVPDYDNLVLSHAERGRVISDEHRKRVFLSAARVRATFLIDALLPEARSQGYDRAQVWTQSDNARARRLYEGRGFVPSDGRKTSSENGLCTTNALCLRRFDLPGPKKKRRWTTLTVYGLRPLRDKVSSFDCVRTIERSGGP